MLVKIKDKLTQRFVLKSNLLNREKYRRLPARQCELKKLLASNILSMLAMAGECDFQVVTRFLSIINHFHKKNKLKTKRKEAILFSFIFTVSCNRDFDLVNKMRPSNQISQSFLVSAATTSVSVKLHFGKVFHFVLIEI